MNLVLTVVRNCKCLGHCFSIWCSGNSWKILTTNQFLFNTIFFTKINIPFFQLCSDLFSIAKKINQIRSNVVCVVGSPVFVCFAITMGRYNAFKGYLRYKTITPENVLSEVKNFFIS